MIDRRKLAGQDGTSLAELLVVVLLLGVLGTLTTGGLVAAFRSQLTTTRDAETLDEVRLSVQRMRDTVRGADEVCASSTGERLVVWTDENGATVDDAEVTIFEVDPSTSQLTSRKRNSSAKTLISDVIVTPGDVFTYPGGSPASQPPELQCKDGVVLSAGGTLTSSVGLEIEVENEDGVNTVATSTNMRVRNVGLADIESGGGAGTANDPPTASIAAPAECKVGTECKIVGTGTDPESQPVTYAWDLDGDGDLDDATTATVTPTYSTAGTVQVSLRVYDELPQESPLATATITILEATANQTPVAAFSYRCIGGTCDFDAKDSAWSNYSEPGLTESSDAETPKGSLSYSWTFTDPLGTVTTRPSGAAHTLSFSSSPISVKLTVTDPQGASSESVESIVTSNDTIVVAAMKTVGGPESADGNSFTASFDIRITTTGGAPREGVQVSVDLAANGGGATPVGATNCTTKADGWCQTKIQATAQKNRTITFTVKAVDPGGTAVYDADQNLVTPKNPPSITATKNTTTNKP